jgi:hypothetical protein
MFVSIEARAFRINYKRKNTYGNTSFFQIYQSKVALGGRSIVHCADRLSLARSSNGEQRPGAEEVNAMKTRRTYGLFLSSTMINKKDGQGATFPASPG